MPENLIDRATFDELKSALGDDYILELLETWYDDAPKILNEMQSALGSGDVEAFRRSSHALKSNASSFGATNLAVLCKELEFLARDQRLDLVGNKLEVVISEYEKAVSALKSLSQA